MIQIDDPLSKKQEEEIEAFLIRKFVKRQERINKMLKIPSHANTVPAAVLQEVGHEMRMIKIRLERNRFHISHQDLNTINAMRRKIGEDPASKSTYDDQRSVEKELKRLRRRMDSLARK